MNRYVVEADIYEKRQAWIIVSSENEDDAFLEAKDVPVEKWNHTTTPVKPEIDIDITGVYKMYPTDVKE